MNANTNITNIADNHFELGYFVAPGVEDAKDVKVITFAHTVLGKEYESQITVVPVESRNVKSLYVVLPFTGGDSFKKVGPKAYANTEAAEYVTWSELVDVAAS